MQDLNPRNTKFRSTLPLTTAQVYLGRWQETYVAAKLLLGSAAAAAGSEAAADLVLAPSSPMLAKLQQVGGAFGLLALAMLCCGAAEGAHVARRWPTHGLAAALLCSSRERRLTWSLACTSYCATHRRRASWHRCATPTCWSVAQVDMLCSLELATPAPVH